MIDGNEIRRLINDATRSAARHGKQPFVMTKELAEQLVTDRENFDGINIPSFGDYIPKGWTVGVRYFVDSSGVGLDTESAMTMVQFMAKMVPGRGYAMTQEGQFQIYVTEFIKKEG